MAHRVSIPAALLGLALLLPGSALAQSAGGAAAPEPTQLISMGCGQPWSCETGQELIVTGRGLDGVESIEFLGGRGRTDNRTARPVEVKPNRLTLVVPAQARSGRVRAITVGGDVPAPQQLTVTPGAATVLGQSANADGVFPIAGRHDMGQSDTNNFGGARNHGGQDMFAECGTPLVAVRDSTVQFAAFQDRAGNYVVLQDDAGQSYAYMHMRDRALVRKGDRLRAGEQIGYVGETGRATGCHLHFELWTAPGWYTGGEAIDPLPQLRLWERQPHKHK